jgi:predicted nucleotidyltransferase component of viral defense system
MMIKRKEIRKIAEESGVPKSTIEKDWIMGHFLDAIYSIKKLKNNLVFKGGTCLKKCYYHDYRFSDDLDFTSRDSNLKINEKEISEVSRIIEEKSGAQTVFHSYRELHYDDILTGYEAKIKYWGPDHDPNVPPPPQERWNTIVKLEIILYERLLFQVNEQPVNHPYSDTLSSDPLIIPVYSLIEIITEKIRSLVQRSYTAPRVYFDIWYILQNSSFNKEILREKILEKLSFKGLQFKGVDMFMPLESKKTVVTGWEQSLRHQVSGELPDFEKVESNLRTYLQKIFIRSDE